ncbi:hypothetical protein MNEG_16697, partial [Monoraphidium neglectum]
MEDSLAPSPAGASDRGHHAPCVSPFKQLCGSADGDVCADEQQGPQGHLAPSRARHSGTALMGLHRTSGFSNIDEEEGEGDDDASSCSSAESCETGSESGAEDEDAVRDHGSGDGESGA